MSTRKHSSARQLVQLFRAIAESDEGAARAIASDICRLEARQGHGVLARELRGALSSRSNLNAAPPNSATLISSAVVPLAPRKPMADIHMPETSRRTVFEIVREWTLASRLAAHNIPRRSKLLFHGPPGCGKSVTAQALGIELGLPVYLVRFDAVIGAYLGQTASHLRQIFQFAESNACILLLDELDALGKQRGNPLDVGELDRIVIALLQELEHSTPKGLVVATTNLPGHLDDAIWRRFDLVLGFEAPSAKQLMAFAKEVAASHGFDLPRFRVPTGSSSYAAAERLVLDEIRSQILRSDG
jgi:SpoVK/Ycf46/Vps4 family AAA+-type ATPase